VQSIARLRRPPPLNKVTPTGFEPDSAKACSKSSYSDPARAGVAHLYANQLDSTPIDPDLATVIQVWPMLPEAMRRAVLEMVREALPDAT
jgi:hypothetical protein